MEQSLLADKNAETHRNDLPFIHNDDFTGDIAELIEVIENMPLRKTYFALPQLRMLVGQLDMIISKFQNCCNECSGVGEAHALLLVFTLKRQLSASRGLSTWVLHCFVKMIEGRLGAVEVNELHDMISDYLVLLDGTFQNEKVHLWARCIDTPHASSVIHLVKKSKKIKEQFIQHMAQEHHSIHDKYKENTILDWFLWGLVRNVNRGNVGFLDQVCPLLSLQQETGVLAWSNLGRAVMTWDHRHALDATHFTDGSPRGFLNLVSLDMPKFTMELVNLRSAIESRIDQVDMAHQKCLALLMSGMISGIQFLGSRGRHEELMKEVASAAARGRGSSTVLVCERKAHYAKLRSQYLRVLHARLSWRILAMSRGKRV